MSGQAAATSDADNSASATTPAAGDGKTTEATTPESSTTPPADGGSEGSILGDGKQGQTSGEPGGPADGAELVVTLPEGMEVDKGMLEAFTPVAKEIGLNSESASKLAAWYGEQSTAAAKANSDAWAKQGEDWYKQLESDPDIGGQKFSASKAAAGQAVMRFGGPELVDALQTFGLDNHPAFVKAFVRIGNEFKEDTTGGQGAGGETEPTEADVLANLYSKSQGKETGK